MVRIGVDIDGVLCDVATPTIQRINAEYGTAFTVDDIKEWSPALIDGVDFTKEIRRTIMDRGLTKPVYDGAVDGVASLRAAGHDVIFLTSRKDDTCIFGATIAWVRRYFGESNVYFTHAKWTFPVDLMIDDNADTIIDFVETGRRGVLFSRPWNSSFVPKSKEYRERILKTNVWKEVLEWI